MCLVFLFFVFTSKYTYASSESIRYTLIGIDDTSFLEYYIFTFCNSKDTIQVISEMQLEEKEGCYKYLRIGEMYELTIKKSFLHDIAFPLHGGLTLIDEETNQHKVLLKPGESFYKAEEINGKLFIYKP